MSTFFISDIHLDESRPEITRAFLHFLQHYAQQADAIYILGDLFEVWIGDDEQTELHRTVAQALRALPHVYFMHGNRDFLLDKAFAQDAGCKLLPDPCVINLYQKPTLLMHGDTLCMADKNYLKYRALVQNFFCKKLFLGLPLRWRQAIAMKLRRASQQHVQAVSMQIMDVVDTEVTRIMGLYGVTQLIHGHTHRPTIRYFKLNGRMVRHIVLSDWETYGNVLICDSQGNARLENFTWMEVSNGTIQDVSRKQNGALITRGQKST